MSKRLSPLLIFGLAVGIGVIVANLYYLQPLLHQVRSDFHISTIQTSALVTLIQVGYATGLAFVLPLGDLVARKRLITAIFVTAAAAMLTASFVHAYAYFAVITVVIGLTSVGGQVIIPFVADLTPPEGRGRTVARLMSGLLMGILLSRTFSGILAESIGWRGVYRIAALLLATMGVVFSFVLPSEEKRAHVAYHRLVASSFGLLREFSTLRRRAWFGGVVFAAFSALWSTLAFHLAAAPFNYSNTKIGLFGLLGVGGVMAANLAGKHADQNRHQLSTQISSLCIIVAYVLLWLGATNIWVIIVGIFVLDVGVQGIQITNQVLIYAIAPEKRSRINSAYMVCYFTGGAIGSLLAGFIFSREGWSGMCVLGLCFGALLLVPSVLWREEKTPVSH